MKVTLLIIVLILFYIVNLLININKHLNQINNNQMLYNEQQGNIIEVLKEANESYKLSNKLNKELVSNIVEMLEAMKKLLWHKG